MSRRTKRIIAVVELFLALAILVYALGPRNLEAVSRGVYTGPETLQAIHLESRPANAALGEEGITVLELDPSSEAGRQLLELLERSYIPYYADGAWDPVSYETEITLTTDRGDFVLTFTEAAPIRADSDLADKVRTYRVFGGSFQSALLEFVLEQSQAA